MSSISEEKKKTLKEIIEKLNKGTPPEEVKAKFKQILDATTSEEIATIEQELVKEGMERQKLHKLCDVHLAVFGDQITKEELHVSQGHPVNILLEEHKILLADAEHLQNLMNMIEPTCDSTQAADVIDEVQKIVADFHGADKHYQREENILFPLLEKHGITEPPAIMWMEHNQIREMEKKLHRYAKDWNSISFQDFKTQFGDISKPFCSLLTDHFFKEGNILFPASLQAITDEEWTEARKEFDEIGYCCFTPKHSLAKLENKTKTEAPTAVVQHDVLQFDTGALTKEEIEGILDSLPVDVSFIDKDDRVKYFNKADKRIFVRTRAVLGRSVQMCHPEKSIQIVNKIIEAFQNGEKDKAQFWINLNSRLIHIRYFAVRNKDREYLGTMEVTQDLTDLKKIEGQKRLLDWKD